MNMTLERVRDWHRWHAAMYYGSGDYADEVRHTAMADAIDRELQRRGEAVAQINAIGLELLREGTDARCWPARPRMPGHISLYTSPPAVKAEITDDMVRGWMERNENASLTFNDAQAAIDDARSLEAALGEHYD